MTWSECHSLFEIPWRGEGKGVHAPDDQYSVVDSDAGKQHYGHSNPPVAKGRLASGFHVAPCTAVGLAELAGELFCA